MDAVVLPLPPEANAAALALWEDSVRATHPFVTEEHVRQYKVLVQDMLEKRPLDMYGLYVTENAARSLRAIMGVEEGGVLGMLFVATEQRGRGYGTRMVQYALDLGVCKVDVNEQNTAARAFYERRGFVAQGVAPLDGVGNPYPLVHMALA